MIDDFILQLLLAAIPAALAFGASYVSNKVQMAKLEQRVNTLEARTTEDRENHAEFAHELRHIVMALNEVVTELKTIVRQPPNRS